MDNLTVVIPYRNERAALNRLLESLPAGLPVIVVDDQSETPPDEWEDVTHIRPAERGYFAGACNAGIEACDTDVLVLNQDVWFDGDGWLDKLGELRAKYAMIGDGVKGHPAHPQGYVQGTFMFLRRDMIRAVGLLNQRDWPLWGCTAEYQLRACRAGFAALPMPGLDWFRHEERHGSHYGASITQALGQEPEKRGQFIRTPPLISVVIPCYNYGRYLHDAINSLIGGKTCLGQMPGQTFQGFEVVIVDDASTDDTPKIAAKLADPWKSIRYVRRGTNGGTPAALNTGARESYGRYLQVLSADDMLEPAALETLLRVLEANPRRFAYSALRIVTGHKRRERWPHNDGTYRYDFERLLVKNHVPAGVLLPKTAWQEVGGWPEEFRWGREDWAMAVALGRVGWCGIYSPETLYLYRRDGQNRTLTNSTPTHRASYEDLMRQKFPDLYKGERPMGCCGGRRTTPPVKASSSRTVSLPSLPGASGMVRLEYIGKNVGRTAWTGTVTHARYTFSGSDPRKRMGWVAKEDVPGLLSVRYDKAPAFRLYVEPAPEPTPEPAPEPEPEPVPEPVVELEVLAVPEPPVAPAPPPPADPLVEVARAEALAGEEKPKRKRRSRKAADA